MNQMYEQKYIKYKAKYLNLKNQIGGDKCDDLLKITSEPKFVYTIREIDKIIHKLDSSKTKITIDEHKAHQKYLIELIKGCEIRIFNDPNVHYAFRTHFRGKCGTMSNILTSGFYILYNHLIQNFSIEINIEDDLKTIFNAILHINFNPEINNLVIDPEEYASLINIIKFIKIRYQGPLFNNEWFDNLLSEIKRFHTDAMKKDNWYSRDEDKQGHNAGRLIYTTSELSKLMKSISESEDSSTSWDLYEYYPEYINRENIYLNNINLENFELLDKYFAFLKNLFNPA